MDEREEKESKIVELILGTTLAIPSAVLGGALIGGISSLFNPFFIPQTIKNTIELKEKLTAYYIMSAFAITGYLAGTGCIAYNIIENPSKPSSYIPLLTNLIGGLIINKNSKKH